MMGATHSRMPGTMPLLLLCVAMAHGLATARAAAFPVPAIECAPRTCAAVRATTPPVIDGALDDAAWVSAEWTEPFTDIEGGQKPAPRFATRAKISWDAEFFYVAAEMEEPDLWATYTERDAVIYHENDFEVFIDPDGDTHEYYELEINALNTVWDLLLLKPYRDGGPAVNSWDIAGLKTAVKLNGTLNDPSDRDAGWSVEIALPWKVLSECAHRPAPPRAGDRWWVNFSRVEWRRNAVDGRYVKSMDPETGRDLPEDNWVWSPQGLVAMHYPEMWGIVTFLDAPGPARDLDRDERLARRVLWGLYYAQKEFHEKTGRYAGTMEELLSLGLRVGTGIGLESCGDGYQATFWAQRQSAPYRIRDDGLIRCDTTP